MADSLLKQSRRFNPSLADQNAFGVRLISITKTRLFKYIENFTPKKGETFQVKSYDIFHISAKKIDCGYLLEPHLRGGSSCFF